MPDTDGRMHAGVETRRSGQIARLVALALLFAQIGATSHAYAHLSDDAKGGPVTAQVCGACLSFAPLASAIGSSPAAFLLEPSEEAVVASASCAQVPRGPAHRAYRSRAPPVLH